SDQWSKSLPSTPMIVYGDFTITPSNDYVIVIANAPVTVEGNFSIAEKTWFMAGGHSHAVRGNFINNGTYAPGIGTMTFNGNGRQSVGGKSMTSFNNLTINSEDITLTGSVDVDDTLK